MCVEMKGRGTRNGTLYLWRTALERCETFCFERKGEGAREESVYKKCVVIVLTLRALW